MPVKPSLTTDRTPTRLLRSVAGGLILGLLTVIGLPACSTPSPNRDLAEQRLERRRESIRRIVRLAETHEQSRPARLDCAFTWIGINLHRHGERFDASLERAGRWIDRDIERAPERQSRYQRKLEQILRGKPEKIEPDAIRMFF